MKGLTRWAKQFVLFLFVLAGEEGRQPLAG